MASVVGGGETSYYCDYHYTYTATSELKGALVGGIASIGPYCGPFYVRSSYAPSGRNARLGSRLCFMPTTT